MFGVSGADTKALNQATKEVAVPIAQGLGTGLAGESTNIVNMLKDGLDKEVESVKRLGGKLVETIADGARESTALVTAIREIVQQALAAGSSALQGGIQTLRPATAGPQAGAGPVVGVSGASDAMRAAATIAGSASVAAAAAQAAGGGAQRGPQQTTYIGGDSYNMAVSDTAATALVTAMVAANRRERLNFSMGGA
jgi:hypothetical protein